MILNVNQFIEVSLLAEMILLHCFDNTAVIGSNCKRLHTIFLHFLNKLQKYYVMC